MAMLSGTSLLPCLIAQPPSQPEDMMDRLQLRQDSHQDRLQDRVSLSQPGTVPSRTDEPNGGLFCSNEYKTFICLVKMVTVCPHLDHDLSYKKNHLSHFSSFYFWTKW